jgi:eukaryotic-like serine/threonine-protein kinase
VSERGGVLIYASTRPGSQRRSLVWVDRAGHETPITRDTRAYAAPRISPDGTSILVRITEETTDIWRYEIARGVLARLTSETYVDGPVWSANGKDLIYMSNRSGTPAVYRRPATGEGEPTRVGEGGGGQYPDSLSADGRTIVATHMSPTSGGDLYLVPLDGAARPVPLLVSGSPEYLGSLSPDAKWFVYVSRASGQAEVFVRPVAEGGEARQVSIAGGTEPRWSRAGGEIFYRAGQKMMVARVRTGPALEISVPETLFAGPYEVLDGPFNYDVTPDGRRFLMVKMHGPDAPTELKVVTGWDREVRNALSAAGGNP